MQVYLSDSNKINKHPDIEVAKAVVDRQPGEAINKCVLRMESLSGGPARIEKLKTWRFLPLKYSLKEPVLTRS